MDEGTGVGARHSFARNGLCRWSAWSGAAVAVVHGVNHMKSTAASEGRAMPIATSRARRVRGRFTP